MGKEKLLSVIIPARNEVRYIAQCLLSVFTADPVDSDLEVIVVDGMSTDGTREVLATWCEKHANLRVLDNPRGIVPAAMNIGIGAARGDWIIRLDAHSEYPQNYFSLCLETLKRSGADNVGGMVLARFETESFQGRFVQALTTHRFGVGNSGFRTGAKEGWADTVPFGCFPRAVFERIGFFDERLVRNQDYELNRRLIRLGGRIWFNPAIQITYHNQRSLSGLMRQAFNTGKWNPWMWYVAPYSFAWRHAIPLGFVCVLVVTCLSLLVGISIGAAIGAPVLLLYLGLALIASVQQALRYGWGLFLYLPTLFLLYHLAYGLGSLWGIVMLLLFRSPVQSVRDSKGAPVNASVRSPLR